MKRYVYDQEANTPQDLASGRVLAPGDEVQLSAQEEKHPHNKRLIEEGRLAAVNANKKEGAE